MTEEQQQKFDAGAALGRVREARADMRRRTTWGKSKLGKHHAELVKLRAAGGSLADLVFWLRSEKRIKVAGTTVMRYLQKLQGLGGKNG